MGSNARHTLSQLLQGISHHLGASLAIALVGALSVAIGLTHSSDLEDIKNWPLWLTILGLIIVGSFGANAIRISRLRIATLRVRRASGKRIAILLAKLEGDTEHDTLRKTVWESIKAELGDSVEIILWPRILQLQEGHERDVDNLAAKLSRKWLNNKRCDLLVWGRVKAANVISLRITAADVTFGPKSYALEGSELDLPVELISHLGVAISARLLTSAPLHGEVDQGKFLQLATTTAERLELILAQRSESFEKSIRATLHYTYALIIGLIGERTGSPTKLREALWHIENAYRGLDRAEWRVKVEILDQWGDLLTSIGRYETTSVNLHAAIEKFNEALNEIGDNPAAYMRGSICNHLGTALRYLGEREQDPIWLQTSSEAFVTAQKSWARETYPFEWAAAQNNLGNVLRARGERSGKAAHFKAAIDAHRKVLEIYSRVNEPRRWAMVHNNIGLSFLGLARSDESDSDAITSSATIGKYYQEATSCFRMAISGTNRTDSPILWAEFQNNLSTALVGVGECFFDIYAVREAIKASRLALEEARMDRAPEVWGRCQGNLGNALRTLGEFSRDLVLLNEALLAYRNNLGLYSETTSALNWALGNDNIAGLLVSIADISGEGTAELDEAAHRANSALHIFERAEAAGLARIAKNNLARANALLSDRKK